MCLIVAQPVAWILLTAKHSRAYTTVFKAMKKAALQLNLELKPQRLITGLEGEIIKAVLTEVGPCFLR